MKKAEEIEALTKELGNLKERIDEKELELQETRGRFEKDLENLREEKISEVKAAEERFERELVSTRAQLKEELGELEGALNKSVEEASALRESVSNFEG